MIMSESAQPPAGRAPESSLAELQQGDDDGALGTLSVTSACVQAASAEALNAAYGTW